MNKISEFFKGIEFYFVGGCVRDMVMGNTPKDYDLITPLTPDKVEEYIKAQGRKVWKQGVKFGTLGVKLDGEIIEITTYRTEDYKPKDRKPEVQYTTKLEEDLKRRDFTINTLVSDKNGNIKDYFGGINDINDKIVRAVGNPKLRFKEDPLRILRGIRFAVKYGFKFEETTEKKIESCRWLLLDISKERIVEEVNKILTYIMGTKALFHYNTFQVIIPNLHLQKDFEQNSPHHDFNLETHTCLTVANVCEDYFDSPKHLWSALLHDIAKPHTQTLHKDGTKCNYINHDLLGGIMAKQVCKDLKMSNEDTKFISETITNHIQQDNWLRPYDNKSKKYEVDKENES
jgi:tRNA nucleotidyltransferase (CCA-adding enzyme)